MKHKGTLIAAAALLLVCLLAGGLYLKFKPQTTKGEKEVTIVVVHGDKTEKTFQYHTDAEYLVDVLKENQLVDGEEGEYGLFIQSETVKRQMSQSSNGGALPRAVNR